MLRRPAHINELAVLNQKTCVS